MLIISKYIDYYDKLVNMYGVDTKIVYNRNLEVSGSVTLRISDESVIKVPDPVDERIFSKSKIDICRSKKYNRDLVALTLAAVERGYKFFCILVVCGRPFLLGGNRINSKPVYEVADEPFMELLYKRDFRPIKFEDKRYFINLSKVIKNPVYIIYDVKHTRQQDECCFTISNAPALCSIIGFTKLYSEEQIYQDISYHLTNVVNDSPDVQPEGRPPQSDVEKIVAHGLDLKTSFRHRK